MGTIMTVLLTTACLLLLVESGLYLRNLAHLERLERSSCADPSLWPRVSVIMTARDEVHAVGAAVASRLAEDYPDFQLLLVDDRSTDGTADAATAAAQGDPRFTLVRVDAVPNGWLGKVHAMREGLNAADGDWILFSDADVVVEPGTLRLAIAACDDRNLDLLALIPAFRSGSFLVDGVWAVFLRGLVVMADPADVRNPKRKTALGAGAFNLVRRSALTATPGLEHLRMETGDDVALAAMVKQAGGRIDVMDGSGSAQVAIYRSVPQLLKGIEKNGSTTAALPFPLLVLGSALFLSLLFSSFVATLSGVPMLQTLGAITLVLYTSCEIYGLRRNTGRGAPAILWPFGCLVVVWGVLRATWLAHRNGGIWWRDTFYSLEQLAEGRRFEFQVSDSDHAGIS